VLVLPRERYGTLSPDGRWLAQSRRLFDLAHDRGRPRLEGEDEYTSLTIILGAKRPPLRLDDEGNLWGVDDTAGSRTPAQELLEGKDLTEVAWDATGTWLALGSRDGRVWIVEPRDEGLATLATALAGIDDSNALPAAWDVAARNEIDGLHMLPREGVAMAETANDHVLLWRRDAKRGWSEPLVFEQRDLHDGGGGLECQPDGKRCIVEGQILSFDEQQLIAMSRALLSGRVAYDAER
jgi:hypothetical protein